MVEGPAGNTVGIASPARHTIVSSKTTGRFIVWPPLIRDFPFDLTDCARARHASRDTQVLHRGQCQNQLKTYSRFQGHVCLSNPRETIMET